MASSRIPAEGSSDNGGGGGGMGGGGGGGGGGGSTRPEEGDYIINWHLQYCISLLLQSEGQLRSLSDQIKAEVTKMITDSSFIKHELPGPHTHLIRLKNEERDLKSTLKEIESLQELFRLIANRSSERIIP